tara:strand:- start:80 stop:241 length:162 start_codon:yes stop_codon:yes gene_type:complete
VNDKIEDVARPQDLQNMISWTTNGIPNPQVATFELHIVPEIVDADQITRQMAN